MVYVFVAWLLKAFHCGDLGDELEFDGHPTKIIVLFLYQKLNFCSHIFFLSLFFSFFTFLTSPFLLFRWIYNRYLFFIFINYHSKKFSDLAIGTPVYSRHTSFCLSWSFSFISILRCPSQMNASNGINRIQSG